MLNPSSIGNPHQHQVTFINVNTDSRRADPLLTVVPADAQVCPAGYNCGSGTDRSTQFAHKCPAGLFCSAGTEPNNQYDSVCDAGHYCIRGTPNYLATQVLGGGELCARSRFPCALPESHNTKILFFCRVLVLLLQYFVEMLCYLSVEQEVCFTARSLRVKRCPCHLFSPQI